MACNAHVWLLHLLTGAPTTRSVAITSFRDPFVWQKSMVLVERIYHLTASFPRNEQYGLSIQLKRAAVSILSNIAEGHARRTGYFLNHLNVAVGSEAELQPNSNSVTD